MDRLCLFVSSLEKVKSVKPYYSDPSGLDVAEERVRVQTAHEIAAGLRALMSEA